MKASGFKSRRKSSDPISRLWTGLTGLATLIILAALAAILLNIAYHGYSRFSWRFLTGGTERDMFSVENAGIFPMLVGTSARVILMTIVVLPLGVITALYLSEYASPASSITKLIRLAITNLAGVPSIVFGLFGLGFFINFCGRQLDHALHGANPVPIWGQPGLLWASLTLAVMTLPVVIVATEESLRAIPLGLREASLALGATRLQTVLHIVLPQALPGIFTGAILAIGRAAGEVAPILFTGAAYYMGSLPKALSDQFVDLGYHTFILCTQSPNIDETRPILYATVLALLLLTFFLNLIAVIFRARLRRKLLMTAL